MSSPAEVRSLYRQILRAAARWPSVKRTAIAAEIRRDFRENAGCPPEKVATLVKQGREGLETMQRQTRARSESSFSFR